MPSYSRNLIRFITDSLRWLVLKGIRAYQLIVSPILPASCRFYPTCSSYAGECFKNLGPTYASYLTIKRILRCHPWHPGGVDLPPSR